jgi:hypothetical protein
VLHLVHLHVVVLHLVHLHIVALHLVHTLGGVEGVEDGGEAVLVEG